jgi:hypothetical protein
VPLAVVAAFVAKLVADGAAKIVTLVAESVTAEFLGVAFADKLVTDDAVAIHLIAALVANLVAGTGAMYVPAAVVYTSVTV